MVKMSTVANNYEYHELIEELTEKKFFGEITFYFQGGNIESSRISERNTKSEIRERMQVKKCRSSAISMFPDSRKKI
jgi:hypothetical protein